MRKQGHRGLTFIHKMIEADFNGGKDNKIEDKDSETTRKDDDKDVAKFIRWR